MNTVPVCRLCQSSAVSSFCQDKRRHYFRCHHCYLVFVDEASLLAPAQEKAIYDQHQNDPNDSGYRRFLSRLAVPLLDRIGHKPQRGLDFGCGPGPTLSMMLQEAGHAVALYDPFYISDTTVLAEHGDCVVYDFVACTEAIEHFHHPHREWRQLLGLLKPQGWLGLMTKLVIDESAFKQWHYKNDLTHVSFFSRATFEFLAQRDGLRCEFEGDDVILLQKNGE